MARRRRRGDGSVFYDHAERVWIARVTINGQRHKRRAPTELRARRELEELRRKYATVGGSDSLGDYLQAWLTRHRRVRPSTLVSYRAHVELHIAPTLGDIPVSLLTADDVDRLIARKLAERKSPATVSRIVTTLRIALNDAVRRDIVPRNVAALVQVPQARSEPVHAMTHEEGDRIVDAFRGHWAENVIQLLHGSGIRLGEALALDQGDVHPDENYVSIRRSKTYTRAATITDEAADAIRAALKVAPRRGPSEPVFFAPKAKTERMRGSSVSHAIPKVLERAGLGRMTPHGFRHGMATRMLLNGTPMREIAEQLGHANPALTARLYAHVVPESLRAAVAATSRRVRSRDGSR